MKLILTLALTTITTLTWAANPSTNQDDALNYAVSAPQTDHVDQLIKPSYSGCQRPQIPEVAYEKHLEGTTILSVRVGTDQKAKESKIIKSSGSSELDNASIATLDSCTFKPLYKNGVAMESWVQLTFKWDL